MILGKSLRKMSDEEALLRVQSDYTLAVKEKRKSVVRADRYLKIYMALDPPDLNIDMSKGTYEADESTQANTYLPIGAAVVDGAVAKLFNTIFHAKYYMEIDYTNWEDHFRTNKVTAHMMKRHRAMRFRYQIYRVLQQMLCYDYVVTAARWLLEEGYVPRRNSEVEHQEFGKLRVPFRRTVTEQVWVPDKVDRPDMLIFPYDSCYHDWTAKDDFNDSRFFFDDRDVTIEELEDNEKTKDRPWGIYTNIQKIKAQFAEKTDVVAGDKVLENLDAGISIDNRKVQIHRCWTRDHRVEWCKNQIINRTDIPGWPLQLWKTYNIPNQFHGMGILQRMERAQYDINASMNARRNFQNLIADPFGVIDRDLVGDQDGAPKIESGKLLVSSSGDASKKIWIHNPGVNINQDSLTDINIATQMVKEQTGIADSDMNQFAKGRRSATEVAKVHAGGMNQTQIISQKLEDNSLIPFYEQQLTLESVFMTTTQAFIHYGQYGREFLQVSGADYQFASEPDFVAKGSMDAAFGTVQLQQFMQGFGVAVQFPQYHNIPNILVEYWRKVYPENYERFVKDQTVPQHNVPAQVENWMIVQGIHVEVSPLNDHAAHRQGHTEGKRRPEYRLWPEDAKARLEQHLAEHEAMMQSSAGMGAGMGMGRMQDEADNQRGLRPPGIGGLQMGGVQ